MSDEAVNSGSCNSLPYQLILRAFCVPDGVVGSFDALLSLLETDSACADDARLRLASYINTLCNQPVPDDVTGHTHALGYGLLRFAGQVPVSNPVIRQTLCIIGRAFDDGYCEAFASDKSGKIVGVASDSLGDLAQTESLAKHFDSVTETQVIKFSDCHVYNLENKLNWYSTEGVLSCNCECIAAPVIDFDDDEYADEDEESEQEEGEEDYAEDSIAQYRIPRTARRA